MKRSHADQEAVKWKQHLLLQPPVAHRGSIWLHACSVGEVGSVVPLIRRLLDRNYPVHLTVVTATGYAHARRMLGEQISLSYLPWDLPGAFARFLNRLQPSLLLLAETEFWPGMLAACRNADVPVVGINTRISDRSFPRYRASRFFWRRFLAPVSLFLAQGEIDAERLIEMGVDRRKVHVAGNLKYAISAPVVDAASLRQQLDQTSSRPILLVASTHTGEDERILDMWPTWHTACGKLLTLIVPRHPERFDQVAETISSRGLKLMRWSELQQGASTIAEPDVILIDAMGILGRLYTVADAVIIAGSLANIGGHNPLEAAICGRGAVTGPYIQNFREIMSEMQRHQAAIIAADDTELEKSITRLLTQPQELKALNGSAARFIQDKGDVLDRMMAEIEPWLARVPKQP